MMKQTLPSRTTGKKTDARDHNLKITWQVVFGALTLSLRAIAKRWSLYSAAHSHRHACDAACTNEALEVASVATTCLRRFVYRYMKLTSKQENLFCVSLGASCV